jgi:predicted permease
MSFLRRIRNLWRNIVHRDRAERDVHDELDALHDLLATEKVAAGMEPAAARRAAGIELGGVHSIKEQVRDVRAGAYWPAFVQDVRYGVRLLVRSPIFTVFAAASLALGIGATAAIFALFDGIVLRKLPVPDPDRLVVASFGGPNGRFNYSMPYPQFEQIRERNTTLSGLFATYPIGRVTVTRGGEPDAAAGLYVTGDYYETLRLAPSAGRLLGPLDDRPGQAVAVLNHAYWRRRFGGRADVVGATVTLNRVPFTIVGVEPLGFSGTEVGRPHDISVPMRAIEMLSESKPAWTGASTTWIYMMGRLKLGVTIEQAEAEMKGIFAQVSLDAAMNANQQRRAREHQLRLEPAATGAASGLRDGYAPWLRLLLMTLGGVLLLASLNVATLLLSRSDARQREIATRLALGASRSRVIRQFLTESIVLASFAAVLGLVLASWGSRVLLRIATPASDRLTVDISPDLRLVAFTVLVAGATCLLFGLIPAIRATSPGRIDSTRHVGGGRQRRVLDRTLVASQVALSLILLVGAGLFLRSLQNLWAQDTGYNRQNVLMFSVDARLAGRRGADVPNTYRRLLDHLREVRGAQFVTMSAVRPVSDSYYFVDVFAEVGGRIFSGDQRIRVAYNVVAPEYFATLGIPLLAGRDFDERDSPASPKVAIISERMARHFTGNPVGQRIGSGPGAPEVIGVVADMRYASVKDLPREVVYHPIFQGQGKDMWYSPTFEVRYAGGESETLASVRDAVLRTEPALTMFRVRTLEQQTEDSFSRERLLAMLSSYFGAFAVLLACVGLYGLMSYAVTRRTAEIGLRIALGAHPSAVRRLIVREATVTVVAGVVVGLCGALVLVRFIRSQLFGIQPHDPVALAGATAVLLAMALAAAYVPARRASRIDPLTALRHE